MRRWRWLALGAPVVAACAQVIGADFDGLLPDKGSGSAGTDQSGGAAGNAGDATPTAGAAGVSAGGSAGASAGGNAGVSAGGGGAAGASGAAGNVMKDASIDNMGGGAGTDMPDAANDVTSSDVGVADHEDAACVDTPIVVINEIKGQGGGPDWIELYNPGQGSVGLDGYTVAQALGSVGAPDPTSFLTFPAGTTLAAGAFLMVVAQQTSIGGPTTSCQAIAATCFTVDWGVAASGERIYLLSPTVVCGTTIRQQVDYLASVMSGQTYARAANGTFQVASPTPGQPNGI